MKWDFFLEVGRVGGEGVFAGWVEWGEVGFPGGGWWRGECSEGLWWRVFLGVGWWLWSWISREGVRRRGFVSREGWSEGLVFRKLGGWSLVSRKLGSGIW